MVQASYFYIVSEFFDALGTVILTAFRDHPVATIAFWTLIVAAALCAGDGLERRGWRAVGWGCLCAAAFGTLLAIGG